jgi:hypothetical protein
MGFNSGLKGLNLVAIIVSHQTKEGQFALVTRMEGMIDIQEILVRKHEGGE